VTAARPRQNGPKSADRGAPLRTQNRQQATNELAPRLLLSFFAMHPCRLGGVITQEEHDDRQ
jgi:hypothetical protein